MKCPRCSALFKKIIMRKLEHPSGAVLDVCDTCGGMWIDRHEVEQLYNFSGEVTKNDKQSK